MIHATFVQNVMKKSQFLGPIQSAVTKSFAKIVWNLAIRVTIVPPSCVNNVMN